MKAGPKLNARIAEEVMGQPMPTDTHEGGHLFETRWDGHWYCHLSYEDGDKCAWKPRLFSTQIADAWLVVEKLGIHFELKDDNAPLGSTTGLTWYASFGVWHEAGIADTAPLAICLAALKAVE